MSEDGDMHRHSEGYYRLLFVANPLPMWVYELDSGRFLAVNREACRHYGYTEEEFLAMSIADLRLPADRERLEKVRSVRPSGHRAMGTWRHRRKDGSLIDVEITSDDVLFDGRQARLVLANDVTENVRIAAALQEREERFRYVSRATNDAIWDWNLVDNTLWWNSGVERLFGFGIADLEQVGDWERHIHPDDRALVVASLHEGMQGGAEQWNHEYRFLRRNGSYAFVYDRAFMIRGSDGQVVRMVGSMTDLSERKEHEDRLREQAMLLDKARDAIIVRGLDMRIRYWNHAAERLYGVPRARAIGRALTEMIASQDEDAFSQADAQVFATGEWSGRIQQCLHDGRNISIDGHWTLLRDNEGAPTGVLKINTDVTERVELEQRLAQSQKLEAIGQLTGGIAHDFNNLLTVIIGNSEMLAEGLGGAPRMQALASMIRTAGERGAELTNRLLAFARRQALEPTVVRPDELIEGMRNLLRRSLGESIDLLVRHAPDLARVSIDPGQFEAAILNLCINARDAMAGGGRLMIETCNVELDQDYADQRPDVIPGRYVQVAVSDTGAGMPPDIAERAFDPFFTTKPKGKGTGLGLSMVYGFTKQSGGHVAIYSEQGVGTVVKLYLPRIDGTSESAAATLDAAPATGGGETVLLVEDDELVSAHASQLLVDLGYRVVIASNGPEALEKLRTGIHVDILFTDVIMPGGMNGPQLAEAAHALLPGLPVLYTSGYTENAIVHHGRVDAGVNLLHKPYRRQTLADKIRSTLAGKQRNPADHG